MQFFDATDDTPEKRIGKVIGAFITAIIYSGVAAMLFSTLKPLAASTARMCNA